MQNDATFNALVSTEELLAQIGLAREFASDSNVEHPYIDKLKRVQMILFDLSHAISKSVPGESKSFESKHIIDLEDWILEYANQLPPQETYIIPVIIKYSYSLRFMEQFVLLYLISCISNRAVVKLVPPCIVPKRSVSV